MDAIPYQMLGLHPRTLMYSIPYYLGLDVGAGYTVTVLDCGVGSRKSKLVMGYPVAG
jgi:hypothetical protein